MYVLKGVSVITWLTAHETVEQTQTVYTMGHRQRDGREAVCLYNVCVYENVNM